MENMTIAELTGAAPLDRTEIEADIAECTQAFQIGELTFFVRYHAPQEAGQDQARTLNEEH